MNLLGLIFLLVTQFFAGFGLLKLFKIDLKPLHSIPVSMITGVIIFSLLPMLLQFFYIPITVTSVILSIIITTLLLDIVLIKKKWRPRFHFNKKMLPALYELPFLIVLAILIFVSVWRCFYFPPFARDVLSGPEAIAEYAVREHTLLNSIFSVNLDSTNNYLKPPFITDLQIIYKMLVCPFGSLWLSVIFISFTLWVYALLKEKIHPVLAGLMLFFFMAMPDLYSYTYVILFDYSNMVLFFAGFYFLGLYTGNKQLNYFLYATLLFGFATFIRSETLVLVAFIVPLLIYYFRKEQLAPRKMMLRIIIFMVIPFFFYFIWINIFVKYYMPVQFNVNNQINNDLGNISVFTTRLADISRYLLFSSVTAKLYGYFIYVFLAILGVDLIIYRIVNKEAFIVLYGIVIVYIGLAFLGYLIPWFDLINTTKRGLFKMLPLMLIYLRNSPFLSDLSVLIRRWEFSLPITAPVVVTAANAPTATNIDAPAAPNTRPAIQGNDKTRKNKKK